MKVGYGLFKLRFVKHVLYGDDEGPKRAFNRLYVGLKSEEDVEEFKRLTSELGIRTNQLLKPKLGGARGRRV